MIKFQLMGEAWEEITTDLYSKIKPIGGTVYSQVDAGFISTRKLGNIWLEFDMNEFEYTDPFYGEQKSTDPFNMQISLWDYIAPLNITSIRQLENLEIKCDPKDKIGAFSNSLHFVVHVLRFSPIKQDRIVVYYEYSLTNSESYGHMTGTIDDHLTKRGVVEATLFIKELQIIATDITQAMGIAGCLTSEVYESRAVREATDLNWSSPNYKGFYVSYK